jgi:hypothetical protein
MKQGRPSTVPTHWRELVDCAGGTAALGEALGMPQSTFYRALRGIAPFPEDKKLTLEILCELYDIKNPLEHIGPLSRHKDLGPLRVLGEAIAKGFPPADRTLAKLRLLYPEHQLLELAEAETTPEEILRAVTVLLESGE